MKLKLVEKWTNIEWKLSNWNYKALYVIFNIVPISQMKVVANCETAKDAWGKLRI